MNEFKLDYMTPEREITTIKWQLEAVNDKIQEVKAKIAEEQQKQYICIEAREANSKDLYDELGKLFVMKYNLIFNGLDTYDCKKYALIDGYTPYKSNTKSVFKAFLDDFKDYVEI